MSMSLTLETRSYQAMWAYGNHIRILNAEEHLSMINCSVVTLFEQECQLGANDQ
jgi:hypothetical protein